MTVPSTPWGLKLARAGQLIAQLRTGTETYLGEHVELVEQQVTAARFDLRLSMTAPIPWHVGPLVGEIAHNCRSALDNVAWSLTDLHSTQTLTPKDQRGVAFPIVDDPAAFHDAARKCLPGAPADLLATVREISPCRVAKAVLDGGGTKERALAAAAARPLARLREQSNQDKHRVPQLLVAAVDAFWIGSGHGQNVAFEMGPFPWVDGSLVSTVTFSGDALPPTELSKGAQFAVALEADVEPLLARSVVARCEDWWTAVASTLTSLAGWLPA